MAALRSRATAQPQAIALPSGARALAVSLENMDLSIGRLVDGEATTECVHGLDEAHDATHSHTATRGEVK